VLHQLHWLPGELQKTATLVYRSLSGMAPACLAADCQLSPEEGRRQLRYADSRTCIVRRTCREHWGPMFRGSWLKDCVTGNRTSDEQLLQLLKTYLFVCWDRGALWLFKFKCSYSLTHLLTFVELSYINLSSTELLLQDSIAIAKKTARCAQYMGALKSFQSPHYAVRTRLLFQKFVMDFCSDRY